MESKYYTPSIEEFHPGFEYEFESYGQGFVKTEVSEDGAFYKGSKRVKHLDREDIESLEWEFESFNVGQLRFSMSNVKLIYIAETGSCHIYIPANDDPTDEDYDYFRGIIRNKSELKRVLKMIGVENK